MTSRAQKKRNRRGSSKAGRPKKEGARYPSGQLRPNSAPNARVLSDRRALLGDTKADLSLASDPMDLAHVRGWITDAQHQAARALSKVYHQASIGPPRMGSGALHEVQPALQIDARSFATMSDDEISELWDTVFADEGEVKPEDKQEGALALWGRIMGGLGKAEQAELFAVCVGGSWPQWVILEARGKEVPVHWEIRRQRLFTGLDQVRSVMRQPRPPAPPEEKTARPFRRNRRAVMAEERLVYVDQAGIPVPMVCEETGKAFSVTRLVRRIG